MSNFPLTVAPRVQMVLVYETDEARDHAFYVLSSMGLDHRIQRQGFTGIRFYHGGSVVLHLNFQDAWSNKLIGFVI